MTILPAFNNKSNIKNLEEIIKENFLTIVSLDEASIGTKMVKSISGLVMTQLFNIMHTQNIDEHIMFIIDEVAIVQNSILNRFLSESRKYNLSLVLSGQYFNQIDIDIQKAIFSNVSNYYTFRVSREDAIILSKNMLMELAVHDSHFAKVKMLTELANRECVVRVSNKGKVLPAFRAITLDAKVFPRKYEDVEKEEILQKNKREHKKIKFEIGNNSLNEIMKSQSTGRRRLADER